MNSLISNQLSLERKLQDSCRELLNSYKESQDWSAVGQLAQTLVTSSSRISDLKRRLLDQEHLPYLEKIPESGQAQLQQEASPTPTDDLNSLEDNPGKVLNLGTHLSGERSEVNGQQVEDVRCPAPLDESVTEKVHILEESRPPSINTSDYLAKQTEGVNKSDTVFWEEGIDELEDQMEQLANQFADLDHDIDVGEAEQEFPDSSTSQVPDSSTSQFTDSNTGIELEVPEQLKANYASSESSDQFFSPSNSLYNDSSGEVEDREADQFEDAQSGSDDAKGSTRDGPSSSLGSGGEREIPFVLSIKKQSEDLAECSQIYSIKTPSEVSVLHSYSEFLQLQGQLASSTEAGSMLVIGSEHMGSDASAELEAFLNRAANLPSVREMDCFVSFLQLDGDVSVKSFHHCGMFITAV